MFRSHEMMVVILAGALTIWTGCDAGPPRSPATSDTTEAAGGRVVSFVRGYNRGYERATREGKPMLVFFAADWCDYCRKMTDETFADTEVVRWCEHFVCVLVDANRETEVCREFRVRGYPTIQFLSPRGVPLNRVVGRQPADQLVAEMQAALGATASRTVRTALR